MTGLVQTQTSLSPQTAESWEDMDSARDFIMTRKWPSTQLQTPAEKNVHLPRQALRRVLLEKLSPGTVHWGKKFKNYKETTCSTSSVVELQFEDGDRLSFDLLVGADGIFSAVRPVKLAKNSRDAAVGEAYPLHYLGVFVMLGICHGVSHPLCDHKVFQVVDGTTRIYVMPFSRSCNGDGCLALRQGD